MEIELSSLDLRYEGHRLRDRAGEDAAMGIVALLRASNDRALGILEQASFVDELKRLHAMSLAEIATALSRSKAWVCLRMGLLTELTPVVRQKLFAGLFPVYAYMYSVRPFMRINGVGKADIEQFVVALSGMHLSMREIDCLARGADERRVVRPSRGACLTLSRR